MGLVRAYDIYIERKPTYCSPMKNFKALALAAITTAATFAGPAAQARNVDQAHIDLARAVAATGITVKINPAACDDKNAMGWYWAARREMVICQENRRRNFGFNHEVNWTAEDLDTLRHEAQHLIQDCMDGSLDGSLSSVYKAPLDLGVEILGKDGIFRIMNAYSEASQHIQVMEVEAFSVARMNNPAEQTADIAKYCF